MINFAGHTHRVSVVIPTYNNRQKLELCLGALDRQTSVPGNHLEVVVVDDGSTEDIQSLVQELELNYDLRYFKKENQGAAAARNFGALQARHPLVIFLDSDVLPNPGLVCEHMLSHTGKDQLLVVGKTTAQQAPELGLFYEVMGEDLFSFAPAKEETILPYDQLISRNFSMKREDFIELGGFDEDFPGSGFEDVEFAYRADKSDYRVLYNPEAAGVHQHTGSLEQVGRHMYGYQIMAALLISKHPELRGQIRHLQDKEPVSWRRDDLTLIARKLSRQFFSLGLINQGLILLTKMCEQWYANRRVLRFLYWKILGRYLYLGFREGRIRYLT